MNKHLFQNNKVILALLFLFDCLKTVGSVGVAILLSVQIDEIYYSISSGDTNGLKRYTLICVLYALAVGMTIVLSKLIEAAYIRRSMISIRHNVFQSIMNQPITKYQSKNSAEYITLLNQNLSTFEEKYLKNIFAVFESCISIIVAILLLVFINPKIAFISIIAMSIPSLIPKLYTKKLSELQSNVMKLSAKYTANIKDFFGGFEVFKTYRSAQYVDQNHTDRAVELEIGKEKMSVVMARLYGITNFASISVQFLIMLLSGIFAVKGIITIGNIIAVTQLTGQVISPAFKLSEIITQIKSTRPIRNQINDSTTRIKSEKKLHQLYKMEKDLVLSNLCFSYNGTPVINNVNYTFERGKKYAIIGTSGSGKSTLLKLIAGYYDNYSGQILIDDQTNMQCDCALVHQNVFLFDDTIRNNITLYENYDEKEIIEAVCLAGLESLIESLPNGLDTKVEENGNRFSGGERQRIALARSLLHKKDVFLVDEATSALDKETANNIENSILSMDNVTCIVVTHHLSPELKPRYDEIIEMKNGALIKM